MSAGIYAVTVETPREVRVVLIQAKSAPDAEKKILSGKVLNVRFHGGSR